MEISKKEKEKLPEPLPMTGAFWRMMDLLALVLVLLLVGLFLFYYPRMPAQVPVYFGGEGQATAWSRRGALLLYPLLGLVFFLVLTRIMRRPDILSFKPVAITEFNYVKQYCLARKFIMILRFLMLGLLNIMFYNTIYAALSGETLLSDSVTTLIALGILISPFVWRSMAARI